MNRTLLHLWLALFAIGAVSWFENWLNWAPFSAVYVLLLAYGWHVVLFTPPRPQLPPWLHAPTVAALIVDGLSHQVIWRHQPLGTAHKVADCVLWLWVLALLWRKPGDWLRRGARRARALLTKIQTRQLERETREAFT